MKKIEVKVLNPEDVKQAERMAVCAARLTQRGEKISDMSEFETLWDKPVYKSFIRTITELPHPTLQKFAVINVVIVGASRRFLAQITRHQNEVKFMSASLQYSDYSGQGDFVIPYSLMKPENALAKAIYLDSCREAMANYTAIAGSTGDHDAAGYAAPQGLRNVLIISATPYQWKHMIAQRTCRRNTDETRYVMLKIWDELYKLSPDLFENAGPFCMNGNCLEGNMSCGKCIDRLMEPADILAADFPLIYEEDKE